MTHVPVQLFENGFVDLVSVLPPNATLSPNSKISQTSLGKSPGVKYANGTYGGYPWRTFRPSIDDVTKWALDGNNIGLLAEKFPACDIDVLDPQLSQLLQEQVVKVLGAA